MPAIDNITLGQIRRRISGAAAGSKPFGPSSGNSPGFESRCVQIFDYNLETEELTIQFVERGTYLYRGVPLSVYVELAESESQGRYFNLYIRDTYSYERIG